jgi:hypothetical protein
MSPTCKLALRLVPGSVFLGRNQHIYRFLLVLNLLAFIALVPRSFASPVPPARVTLTVTGSVPTGVATESYSASIKASGGTAPYTYHAESLPKGLKIDNSTGAISGTCNTAGKYPFTIYVADSSGEGHGTGDFSITLNQPPVSVSVAPATVTILSAGTQEFLATVLNSNNTAVAWTASAGTISSGGDFTAPTVTKNETVTITATSVADSTKTATAAVTVSTATASPVAMEVVFPPAYPSEPYYDDVQTYLLNNPTVSGITTSIEWSAVDNGPSGDPQYDFSAVDAVLATWIGAGKKVNLIVWAVSDTPTNTATPQYVWDNLGASNQTTCTGEKIPNYFSSAFQLPYQAFLSQVIKHYGSNGSIGYIRIGLGRGGETLPSQNFGSDPCTNTFVNDWGWTATTWTNYLDAMLTYEGTLKSPKNLMVGLDQLDTISMPESEAATAVASHISFGNQGLEASDQTNYPHCSSDWCNLFNEYTGDEPLELQTIALSSPEGKAPVGSLVELLPFAVSHYATILEIYCNDWLLAFDPDYPGYGTYGAAYAEAFRNAAQGK